MNNRLPFFILIFILMFSVLFIKLFSLSVLDFRGYKKYKENLLVRTYTDPPERGTFYDRNGRELTQNRERVWVAFNKRAKKKLEDENQAKKMVAAGLAKDKNIVFSDDETIEKISKTLNKPKDEIYKRIFEGNNKKKNYVRFIENGDIGIYKKINDLHIRGVNPEIKNIRYYPERTVASRIIGATNIKGLGLEGLEAYYNEILSGKPGIFKANKFWDGVPIADTIKINEEKINGKDFYLTIDLNIQYLAEAAINEMAVTSKPQYAMAVVMDPNNGEILAIANYPSFDPNNRRIFKPKAAQNFAVENAYEPGSTMKAFTVAAGINEGIGPNEVIGFCSNRRAFGNRSIRCDTHSHGTITPNVIIEESCNIGASYVADRLGNKTLYDYYEKFGLSGRATNQFGLEAYSSLPNPSDWYAIRRANISFGQGVNTTIISMAAGYCVIANGGTYYTPKIIKKVVDENGKIVESYVRDGSKIQFTNTDPGRRVISKNTAKEVTKMLVNCINKGTGKKAQVENVLCAGKTGSAQMVEDGRYSSGRMASFIGFAPANKPEIVVAVWVVKPQGVKYGGIIAAPVWKNIVEKTLRYKKIQLGNPIIK